MKEISIEIPEEIKCFMCESQDFWYHIINERGRYFLEVECKKCRSFKEVAEIKLVKEEKFCNCNICKSINNK